MKNENHNDPSPVGSTRRSFIKKSVVAAVAASSMTIFSGLVNAGEGDFIYVAACDSVSGSQYYEASTKKCFSTCYYGTFAQMEERISSEWACPLQSSNDIDDIYELGACLSYPLHDNKPTKFC